MAYVQQLRSGSFFVAAFVASDVVLLRQAHGKRHAIGAILSVREPAEEMGSLRIPDNSSRIFFLRQESSLGTAFDAIPRADGHFGFQLAKGAEYGRL
jgi:hypothetical protein